MCGTIILNIFIIVINACPILNCMIHYNVCNDKGKYCAILWASGNYCGRLVLEIPLAQIYSEYLMFTMSYLGK